MNTNGCRFYLNTRTAEASWMHAAEAAGQSDLLDTTNMTDKAFEALFVSWL